MPNLKILQRLSGETMRKSAFYKDISRTLRNNLSRFIAMTAMAGLGIGVFSGFAVGCLNVFESADRFYDKQNTYDIKIISTLGLTDDDLLAISKVEGVRSVFGSRGMDVKVKQSNGSSLLANLSTLDSNGMNKPYVLEGTLPTRARQIAVNSKFMDDTGLNVGDSITLTENDMTKKDEALDTSTDSGGSSMPVLEVKTYEITAVVLSPLNISNTKKGVTSVSFSSSSSDYILFAASDSVKSEIYNAIYVTVDGASNLDGYSPEYQRRVDNKAAVIKSNIQRDHQQARYDDVVGDANAKIVEEEGLLKDQMAEAEQKLSEAQKEIDDGWASVKDGQAKLLDNEVIRSMGEHALSDAQKSAYEKAERELREAAAELTDGQAKLDKETSDYKDSIASARKMLADARDKVTNISMAKWYVWDRSDNDSIAGLKSDVSFIQEVTRAFPIIFFLVAILICLTTMTRMVEEDRGLIGTYKSLGYSNYRISMKYIFYAVLACVIGGLLGNIIGFVALPKVIEIIMSNLYVLPTFQLSYNAGYGLTGFELFLVGIVGATAISCAEMLHQRPAELMRPKAPKAGNRILLERVPFIWRQLNFLNKVTCRNLFRYKKRAIMTIVGITGCTMLIVLAFGVKDSVGGLMSDQFDHVTVYDAVVATDSLNTDEMDQLADEWKTHGKVSDAQQLQIKNLTLRSRSGSLDIAVMVIPENADLGRYVHLYDSGSNKVMELPQNGIVVTQNAAKKLALTRGDIVSMQNEDNLEHDFPVAFVAENYAGNYVYVSESCYQAAFGDYSGTSFLLNLTNNKDDQNWLKDLSVDDRIISVSSSQVVRNAFNDVNDLVTMVVYLLISMSAVLALTVLFTLSNINISERERELATIKVLGFQHDEVYSYVNRETFILTLFGILCGLPAGFGIAYGILANVSIAGVAFKVRVSMISYLIAAVITLIFALLVNKMTNKGLREINMVEALKSVE